MIMRYTCDPCEARGKIRFLLYPAPGFWWFLKNPVLSEVLGPAWLFVTFATSKPWEEPGNTSHAFGVLFSPVRFFIVSQ